MPLLPTDLNVQFIWRDKCNFDPWKKGGKDQWNENYDIIELHADLNLFEGYVDEHYGQFYFLGPLL